MNILSPSILSADFYDLKKDLTALEDGKVPYVHIDVMDGIFVPSISYGMPVIKSIRKHTNLFFDVHLMIVDPSRYIKEFAESGADLITFHTEAEKDIQGCIDLIRSYGKKVGLTIKPGTPVSDLVPYLDKIDMALIMTVEPGFGGQKLIPECVDKIRELKKIVDEKGLKIDIEVDGGVNIDNVDTVLDAGSNVIVAGSAVFGGDTPGKVKAFMGHLNA